MGGSRKQRRRNRTANTLYTKKIFRQLEFLGRAADSMRDDLAELFRQTREDAINLRSAVDLLQKTTNANNAQGADIRNAAERLLADHVMSSHVTQRTAASLERLTAPAYVLDTMAGIPREGPKPGEFKGWGPSPYQTESERAEQKAQLGASPSLSWGEPRLMTEKESGAMRQTAAGFPDVRSVLDDHKAEKETLKVEKEKGGLLIIDDPMSPEQKAALTKRRNEDGAATVQISITPEQKAALGILTDTSAPYDLGGDRLEALNDPCGFADYADQAKAVAGASSDG